MNNTFSILKSIHISGFTVFLLRLNERWIFRKMDCSQYTYLRRKFAPFLLLSMVLFIFQPLFGCTLTPEEVQWYISNGKDVRRTTIIFPH